MPYGAFAARVTSYCRVDAFDAAAADADAPCCFRQRACFAAQRYDAALYARADAAMRYGMPAARTARAARCRR